MKVEVLTEIKVSNIDRTFTYNVPFDMQKDIKVGIRVLVPFNNQTVEGFVMGFNNGKISYEAKDIIALVDKNPVINEEMKELGLYMSKKTLSNLINCYQTMLPVALKAKKNINIKPKMVTYLERIDDSYMAKNDKQNSVLKLFQNELVLKEEATSISASSVKTLINNNIIKEIVKEPIPIKKEIVINKNGIVLNEEQQLCYDKIVSSLNNFKTFLLYGVTGSGKTEVYMHVMETVLKNGKEVIVLVPEISLTPQMVKIFKKRFGDNVAILHSLLSDREKYEEWLKIERGEVKIVIGARSAIFAPFTNLGLIIIDEEHTTSYKQDNVPRYNVKDIALYRAKRYNIPLVLGSATPSIESYTNALLNNYELLTIKKRVNDNFPKIKLINMAEEHKKGNNIISHYLYEAIMKRLKDKEQVIILLNKRGYSRVTTCHNCGYVHSCPNCDIPLVYHKKDNKMRCHYCGYEKEKKDICPICKSNNINEYGLGTEKLEQILKDIFKEANIIRMDADTTSKKGHLENILDDFSEGKYNILVGTQMISKGLDFKKVTLVGVVNADNSLNIPDFRSAERTFQLINQVSGRSGRDLLEGEVVIQGYNIDHYSIRMAALNNYVGFYNKEIAIRKELKYPPFYNLTSLKIFGKDYDLVEKEADKICKYLNSNKEIIVLGPSSAINPKINNVYYIQIILKYKNISQVMDNLVYLKETYLNKKVNVQIDINPLKL